MTYPRLTVLTAVYNEEQYLHQAIDSVLAQTYTGFEFLIIDDGSTDSSLKIAMSYSDPRIRVLAGERNVGLPRVLNRGLAAARGELIAVFDGNDICRPERFARQIAFLDKNPAIAAVSTQVNWIDTRGRAMRHPEIVRPVSSCGIDWYSVFDAPLVHSAVMYRGAVVRDELGGYDESWQVGQDAELWFRLRANHGLANLREVLLDCRIDPRSTSGDVQRQFAVGHGDRWRALTERNLMRHLRLEDVPAEWARLWVRINEPDSSPTPDELLAFIGSLDAIRARFDAVHPGARTNVEVVRQTAVLRGRAILRLACTRRAAAVVRFAMLCREAPLYAMRISSKFCALLLLGDKAARIGRRIRMAVRR